MRTQLPLPKNGGRAPNFLLISIVAKRLDASIKMPLGVEVGLGPGDIVLDGDLPPAEKRAQPPPNFRLMSIVAKRLNG